MYIYIYIGIQKVYRSLWKYVHIHAYRCICNGYHIDNYVYTYVYIYIYIIYIYTRYTRIVANIRIHIFRLHENNHISDTDMMLNQERLEMPKIFHKWSWDMGACFHILAFPLITLIIAWVGERPGVWASKNRGYHVLSLWQWARLVWDPMAKAGREVKTRNDLFSRSQRPLI